MKNVKIVLVLVFVFISGVYMAQINKDLQLKGGFVVLESKYSLSESDISKISATNLDEHRFYNLKKKIQIVNGH